MLIVRLSSLGDVVHASTVLADLKRALPQVRIDWVVEEAFVPLVRSFAHVDRVIPIGVRRWRRAPTGAGAEVRAFWRELRSVGYDAIVDLQGLIKSAVVARAARGRRFGLRNATVGAGYEPLARCFYDVTVACPRRIHVVDRSRNLMARALGYKPDGAPRTSWATLAPTAEDARLADPGAVLLVHGAAKADKLLPAAYWVGIGAALVKQGLRLLLPWGTAAERARAEGLVTGIGAHHAALLPRLPLDRLAAVMSRLGGCIGLDTGLAHMAATLGRPTVQIFLEDKSWQAGIYWEPRTALLQATPGVAPSVGAVLHAWAGVA